VGLDPGVIVDGAVLLGLHEWSALASAHEARVRAWAEPYRHRRARGAPHPVHDFLFQYYRYSMAKLGEWHPGPGQVIEDSPDARDRFPAPPYRFGDGVIHRDPGALRDKDVRRLTYVLDLLRLTVARPAHFGCHGMHEWAMVYGGGSVRHREAVPLRLSQAETDAFVESQPIACTHFDAFRFFTPGAKPLNRLTPTAETRDSMEQPGCIHANMDLYKWAYKSMPWVGSDLLWNAFELALDLRSLDMRASPYDLTSLGYEPVRVETPEGRARYREEQGGLSERAQAVRGALITALGSVLGSPTPG
jgi:hypothetical protein